MSRRTENLLVAMTENAQPPLANNTLVSTGEYLTATQAKELKGIAVAHNLPRKQIQELHYMTREKALRVLGLPADYFAAAQDEKSETEGQKFARLHPVAH